MFSGGAKVDCGGCVLLQQQTVVPYLSLGVTVLLFSIGAVGVVLTCCEKHILLSYKVVHYGSVRLWWAPS